MSGERFTVGSVSGYDTGGNQSKWTTVWYVHDGAYCHRIVQTFKGGGRRHPDICEQLALSLAALLNEGHSRDHVCAICDETFEPRLLRFPWRWAICCSERCQQIYRGKARHGLVGRAA